MDLLLKMDYEKRAKHLRKKIPRNQVKGREFSQPVRAANSNFEKGFEKTVSRVNQESRLFYLKFSRICDKLQTFKQGIETKSLHFSENTFKELSSEGKTNCSSNTNIWIQRSPSQNVPTSRSLNSVTAKNTNFKRATGFQKPNASIKPEISMTKVKIAGLGTQVKQKDFPAKKRNDFNERDISRNGRSYRKLREKFTAINNPPPDVSLQKRISFHKDELQRSSELKQMVKKLCEDIRNTH